MDKRLQALGEGDHVEAKADGCLITYHRISHDEVGLQIVTPETDDELEFLDGDNERSIGQRMREMLDDDLQKTCDAVRKTRWKICRVLPAAGDAAAPAGQYVATASRRVGESTKGVRLTTGDVMGMETDYDGMTGVSDASIAEREIGRFMTAYSGAYLKLFPRLMAKAIGAWKQRQGEDNRMNEPNAVDGNGTEISDDVSEIHFTS